MYICLCGYIYIVCVHARMYARAIGMWKLCAFLPPAAAVFPVWMKYLLSVLLTHPSSHALCGWGGGPGVSKLLCHKVNFSASRQAGP